MKKITKNILIATRVAIAIMNIKLNIIITPTTAAMPPPGVMTPLVVTSILTNITPAGAMNILTNIAPVGVMNILTMHTKNIVASTAKQNYTATILSAVYCLSA